MSASPAQSRFVAIGQRIVAAVIVSSQHVQISFAGRERLPARGATLIVAHHYHHLLDGTAIVRATSRPVHIVVALDWTRDGRERRRMERLCAWARWPVVVREATLEQTGSFTRHERVRYVRAGLRAAADLLRAGEIVVVFPEGYPVIDSAGKPAPSGSRDAEGFLKFANGFRTIARLAVRAGARDLTIVPLGFRYARDKRGWKIDARFGSPLPADAAHDDVERAVRALSR